MILTGSKDKLDRIGPRDLIATVDFSDQKAGERIIKLTLDRVKMDLQEDVKIQGFHPATIPIRLEPIVEAPWKWRSSLKASCLKATRSTGVNVNPAKSQIARPSRSR